MSDNWPGTPVGTEQWPGQPAGASATQGKTGIDLLDVPGQALQNLGSSALQFGKSVVQPIMHPIDTAEGLYGLGRGILEKTGAVTPQGYGKMADAAWQAIKDRYGGWENIKKTMATDPVGFFADIATIPAGGEAALSRVPGLIGKAGEISGKVASVVDPLTLGVKGATAGAKGVAQLGGLVTGKGAESISGAARTGFEGGKNLEEYFKNLRDSQAHQEGFVQAAKSALGEMWQERSKVYKRDIAPITRDPTILKFDDIDAAIDKTRTMKTVQGKSITSLLSSEERPVKKLAAEEVREQIDNAIANFKTHPEAHNVEGFDQLKQWIGNLKDHYRYGSPEWKAANDIYSAVRKTIVDQAPDYARVMKDYEEATDKLEEITKTLSLGRKGSEDTALRKLLSAGRSDVNTNFGRRLSLLEDLNRIDPTLKPRLYGQTLAPPAAGGLARLGPVGATAAGLYEHGLNPKVLATLLPILLGTSPRVWGELAAKAGQGGRLARDITPQQIIDAARRYPDARKVILGSRATGEPGEVTDASQ